MNKSPKFEARVRFNWGFHDAAQVVRENWQSRNFGFGPGLKVKKPEDVLEQHEDSHYAHGWIRGYYEALGGISKCESSESAWINYLNRPIDEAI